MKRIVRDGGIGEFLWAARASDHGLNHEPILTLFILLSQSPVQRMNGLDGRIDCDLGIRAIS